MIGPFRNRKVALPALLLAPLAAVALAACGGSDEGSGTPNGGQTVGGTVACDRASIEQGVEAWSKAFGGGGQATLPEGSGAFRCAGGWAVAFPEAGPQAEAITVTVVLEAEGQFWIPKNRAEVCGSGPGDSEVPKSLYRDACQTN
jgi:hypothetical protein